MVNYARRVLGLDNIMCEGYSVASFPESYFDGIVSHHVIEHTVRIRDFVLALSQHLKPGGLLLLQCPCIDSLTSAEEFSFIMSGGHVYAFSETFLTRLLTQYGFDILEVRRSPMDLTLLEPVDRGEWNTTAWADDPGSISLLCRKNKAFLMRTASLPRLAVKEQRSGRPALC
jgi:SAM-dependent methyltransferase